MSEKPRQDSADKVLHLPEELDADHVEHLGAAILATGGLFVEKNITEKVANREEVEEIDVFGTAWRDGDLFSVLVEAKSGHWKNRDLFELLGKKEYLGATTAVLLHRTKDGAEKADALVTRFKDKGHSVKLVSTSDAVNPQVIADLCQIDEAVVSERMDKVYSLQAWRYAFWTERALLRHLTRETKSIGNRVPSLLTARALLDRLNECFFFSDCRDQALHLYDFYSEHPKLTRQMIEERRQEAPGEELRGLSPDEAFRACIYEGKILGVQACMYLQHRARCLLLKAAVDMVMKQRQPTPSFSPKDVLMPHSFRSFVAQVDSTPDQDRLPQLWQAYILGWGGFIVVARAEEEYANIGLEAELSPEQVRAGLNAFDALFPLEEGEWHYEQSGTGLKLLKMVPNAFRALGVQRRRWIYGDEKFLGQLPYLGLRDCIKWANCGYKLLYDDARENEGQARK